MTGADGDELAAWPDDLVAVCLDANSMSRGRLRLEAIEDLLTVVDSQELEIQVWVPEPVIWEWAEHLAADLETTRTAYEASRLHAAGAGGADLIAAPWSAPVDVDQVVSAIEKAVENAGGAILRLSSYPRAAAEGLRDQVLLQGAGRKKGNVKTGAADSTSFRLAEAEFRRYTGSLLIVSGDQDAKHHFASKPNVLLVNSLSRAKAGIVGMRTGPEIAFERFRDTIMEELPRLTRAEFGDADIEGTVSLELDASLRGRVVEATVDLASIDRVLSVSDVEVSRSQGYAAALVDAQISVDRELQVLSDATAVLDMDIETFGGVRAMLEVSAESDNGIDWGLVVDKVYLE